MRLGGPRPIIVLLALALALLLVLYPAQAVFGRSLL